jgi:hypothetical protein
VVCTQKSTQESSIKTCTEQNGTICKSGEKCEGNTVKASDAISCCSAACTKIEATQEKKLEELFTLADIPDYNINKELTGYERNALDYSEGDENHAREILTAGWQENYKAEFRRYSETKNAFGQNAELGYISVSISKYDKSKSPQNFLDNWINERNANFKAIIDTNKAEFEKTIKEQNLTLQSVSMLGGKIGDNSTIFKVGVHSDILDLDMKLYYIYFYKGNYNIYIVAGDLSRQINDEMAIEYARKIESRIP